MSLLYTAITNSHDILVDHKNDNRGFMTEVETYISRSSLIDQEVFYEVVPGLFLHGYTRGSISAICIADPIVPRIQCQNYLRQVYSNFTSNTERAQRALRAKRNDFSLEYSRHLSLDASNFHMHAENSQLAQLRSQANEVIVIAGQNMEQLFQRQNRLEDLNNKADQLKSEAQLFQRTTGQVSRHYWWANFRMKLIIGGVVFAIIFIVLMIILWQAGVFNKSKSSTSSETTS